MAKKTAKSVKTTETPTRDKAAKFQELAVKRVSAAIQKVRLIGNLSSRAGYDYTPEQVEKIKKALSEAVRETMDRFQPKAEGAKASAFNFAD